VILNRLFNEKNIGRISLVNMIAIIFVLTIAMIAFIVHQTNSEFESERALLVKNFIENKKDGLKKEVDRLLDFATFNTTQTRASLKNGIKAHVEDAAAITLSYNSKLINKFGPQTTEKELRHFFGLYSNQDETSYLYVIDKKGRLWEVSEVLTGVFWQ